MSTPRASTTAKMDVDFWTKDEAKHPKSTS